MRRLLWGLAGVVLVSALADCSTMRRRHRVPRELHLPPEPIPETEEFEALLGRKGQLIDAFLSIDALLDKGVDRGRAREDYAALLEKIRPRVEKAMRWSGAHGAVLEVMGALRTEGFQYSSELAGLASRFGAVSECLRARRGLCLSFTMLSMALLDSVGIDSSAVGYPGHVLLRIRKGDRDIEMESTLYGDPVVYHYPADLPERAAQEGFIYGRSLTRSQAAWLYLADRLLSWALLRSKDYHSLRLLERTEEALDGTAEVICAQWGLRLHLRSLKPGNPAGERAEAMRVAIDEYQRLIEWDPDSGLPYLLLSLLYEDHGDRRSCLTVLERFAERKKERPTEIDLLLQARWWLKREEFGLEEFRLSPSERRQSEAFFAEYFPSPDRAHLLEYRARRWLEPQSP